MSMHDDNFLWRTYVQGTGRAMEHAAGSGAGTSKLRQLSSDQQTGPGGMLGSFYVEDRLQTRQYTPEQLIKILDQATKGDQVVVQSQLTALLRRYLMLAVRCPKCGSPNLVRNGHTSAGQQKYHCNDCRRYGTLDTHETQRQRQRQLLEQLHTERVSQRGIARITDLSRTTVGKWLKKSSC